MPSGDYHIVKSFDNQLTGLHDTIARMGGLAESQLAQAIRALSERDSDLAAQVMGNDEKVDAMEVSIQEQSMRVLALRAPVADDLRVVITALRIAGELERIADHAANTAKRTLVINQSQAVPSVRGLVRMGNLVLELVQGVMDAYVERDIDKAMAIWSRDPEIDDLYSSLFRELLTYMMEDPRNITPCTHLLFMAKNIERVGDHATNIAEMIYFMVTARYLTGRPKADTTTES